VPSSILDPMQLASWCPRCVRDDHPAPGLEDLDTYLDLLALAYNASPEQMAATRQLAASTHRVIAGSAYLGEIVPETPQLHNTLGIHLASEGKLDEAVAEFRQALALQPDAANTLWNLGAALAARGALQEAETYLRRSVELDPANTQARNDLAVTLARLGRTAEAQRELEKTR